MVTWVEFSVLAEKTFGIVGMEHVCVIQKTYISYYYVDYLGYFDILFVDIVVWCYDFVYCILYFG